MKIELNGYDFLNTRAMYPAVIYQNNYSTLYKGVIEFSYYDNLNFNKLYASLDTTVAKFTITKIKKQIS